jgi:hypothetical protein
MKKKPKKKTAKTKAKKAKKATRAKPRPKKSKKVARKAKAKGKAKKKGGASPKAKMSIIPPRNSTLAGRVEDYFAKIGVIAFTVKKPIAVGDHLHILGHTTNLEQALESMQINHQPVTAAGVNDAVGIKVTSRVRRGDYVFIIKG